MLCMMPMPDEYLHFQLHWRLTFEISEKKNKYHPIDFSTNTTIKCFVSTMSAYSLKAFLYAMLEMIKYTIYTLQQSDLDIVKRLISPSYFMYTMQADYQ